MSEVKNEEQKSFSWMAFLFAPYYYAGYGKFQKGLVFAVIGFIPLTALIVNIYAGRKAKKELPIGRQSFKWGPAIGVFLIHCLITSIVLSFSPQFQKEMNAATLSDVSGIWRGDTDGAMVTIDLDNKDKYLIINEQKIPVQINSIDTENNIVSLNVNANEKVVVLTLQQIFTEDGKFTLNMVLHNGAQDGLSFVRNLN